MPRKKQIFSVSPISPSGVVVVKSEMKYDELPPKLCLMNDSTTTTKPLKGTIKNKKMPVLPKIDFDENYNREEESCSDDDDDIKLYDMKQVLPFEDVRVYDGHMDELSPNERRFVIEKIQLAFELMLLESPRIQAKIDAANLRIAKLKKLAEEQKKVIANSTYRFSQKTPPSKEDKSTDAPKKVMKRKKKQNVKVRVW
uniref:Uncharacterized protein n=1 Tax=Panagrolaimus sp. PS1159 TaxID=55785 RepID=A0AC35EU99_9BILA